MSFLSNAKQKGNKLGKPSESALVAPDTDVVLDIWSDELFWCLSRSNPKDPTRTLRTLRAGDGLGATSGIAFAMRVFSNLAEHFSEGDRLQMEKLALALEKVVDDFRAGQPMAASEGANGETKSLLLSLAPR